MTVNKNEFVCNSLLLLMVLYYSQQALNISGIGPIVLSIVLPLSSIYAIKVMLDKSMRTNLTYIWLLFLVHNTLYFIFTADYDDVNFLKSVLLNFLLFFPFYYFAKKNILTKEKLILFLLVMLPIFVIQIQQSTNALQLERGKDDVIDNTIYLFIGLLPFVFLFRKKLVSFIVFFIILYFVVLSNKKAAIIAWVFAFAIFALKDLYIQKNVRKIKAILSTVFLMSISLPFAYDLYMSNEAIVKRMELMLEGYSSGRDTIIVDVFSAWYNSDSLITYLMGAGYNSTAKYTHNVSHNDWADMLISFGILGILLYIILSGILVSMLFKKGWDKDKRVIFICVLGIAILVSMTSRWYLANFAYLNFLILPYLLATRKKSL